MQHSDADVWELVLKCLTISEMKLVSHVENSIRNSLIAGPEVVLWRHLVGGNYPTSLITSCSFKTITNSTPHGSVSIIKLSSVFLSCKQVMSKSTKKEKTTDWGVNEANEKKKK